MMDEKKVREAIYCMKASIGETMCEEFVNYYKCDHTKMDDMMRIAIEALEKQLPKKVIIEDWCPSYCPSCGYELSEDLGDGFYRHPTFVKRCPNPDCGQKLDWSE